MMRTAATASARRNASRISPLSIVRLCAAYSFGVIYGDGAGEKANYAALGGNALEVVVGDLTAIKTVLPIDRTIGADESFILTGDMTALPETLPAKGK